MVKPSVKKFCIEFSKDRNFRRNRSKKFWLAYLKVALMNKNWNEITSVKNKNEITFLRGDSCIMHHHMDYEKLIFG